MRSKVTARVLAAVVHSGLVTKIESTSVSVDAGFRLRAACEIVLEKLVLKIKELFVLFPFSLPRLEVLSSPSAARAR